MYIFLIQLGFISTMHSLSDGSYTNVHDVARFIRPWIIMQDYTQKLIFSFHNSIAEMTYVFQRR